MNSGVHFVLWLSCRNLPLPVLELNRPWLEGNGVGMLLTSNEAAKHKALG